MTNHKWKVGDTFRCIDCDPRQPNCTILGIIVGAGSDLPDYPWDCMFTGSHDGDLPGAEWNDSSWEMSTTEPYDWPDEILASYTAHRLIKGD